MTKPRDKIIQTMQKIRQENADLFTYKGFGYCAYLSQLLQARLTQKGINARVLFGEIFTEDPLAKECQQNMITLIKSISDHDSSTYGAIKAKFVKRGNRLPARTGHAVLFYEDEVFDITSEQFGLPEAYPYWKFILIWKERYTGTVQIEDKFSFGPAVKTPFPYYQEEPGSTMTHEGKEYDLNILFKAVFTHKQVVLPVELFKWVLDHTTVDKDRLARADISKPSLVYRDLKLRRWVVLDGAHRLTVAVRDGIKSLDTHVVSDEMLAKALIPYHQKATEKRPLYHNWK